MTSTATSTASSGSTAPAPPDDRTAPAAGAPPAEPARHRVGLRSLLPYLRAYRAVLVTVAVLSLVETVGMLAQPLLVRAALERVGAEQGTGALVGVLLAALTAVALASGFRDYLLQRTAEGMVLTVRRTLVGTLLRLPVAEYDQRRTGDLLSRVGADTTLLRAVVTSGIFESVSSAALIVGSAVAMLLIDPTLFLVTAVALVVGVGTVVGLARRVRGASQEAQDRVGAMTSAVERAVTGVRTIRAAGAEEREARVVDADARAAHAAGLRMARIQAMINPATTTTLQLAFLAVLGVGGSRAASGAMSVGDVVAFLLFLFTLWSPLGRLLQAFTRLQSGLGALHRVEEVTRLPQESTEDHADLATSGAGPAAPAIEFHEVGFGYAAERPILDRVSFTVPRGTRTAVVGPSGAGKSTLLALLERFYDVRAGSIRVEGVDLRSWRRTALRARMGYVEQGAPVLAGTLRDNLLLAAPDASDEDMRRVLAQVNLAEVLTRDPLGLDAQVGEAGVLLSGGEAQRLALARTLLAAPPILLLDEATSALDSRNESTMKQAVDAASRDRTVLVVAHRLATVLDSDQIVVLDHGRVAAVGPHEELIHTSPLYRELASQQLLVAAADAEPAPPAAPGGTSAPSQPKRR